MHAPASVRFQKNATRTVSNSRSSVRPHVQNRQLLKSLLLRVMSQRLKSAVRAKRLGEPQSWSR
jgi:hypothetical protein